MAADRIPSEDVPGEKWDRCVADAALKTGHLYIILIT